MNELRCPHCGQVFTIDESQYDAIASQVRNAEFQSAVNREVQAVRMTMDAQHKVEVQNAVAKVQQAAQASDQALRTQLAGSQAEVVRLNGELQLAGQKQAFAVMQARNEEKAASEGQIRDLQTELNYYKDLKTRMSTKMVGESLEQHCLMEFNRLRPLAFPNAYFEKDNAVSATGSKGDFIYREEVDGVELLSIMFEMKNEMDTTATKHRNEDFLKELDKDRREKRCEYAILVSMLEADNDYYNDGIVDVSHRYPKMYVIRPQFFIPIISILRNAALNAMDSRRELKRVQDMNVDVVQFEQNMLAFKDLVGNNYRLAQERFSKAIQDIDNSISHMQKIKEDLLASERHLRLLSEKTEENLTIPKLTKNAPAVRAMFDEIHSV